MKYVSESRMCASKIAVNRRICAKILPAALYRAAGKLVEKVQILLGFFI